MAALTNKPNVAQRIIALKLADNKLTSINIPEALVDLQEIDLESNQLTSINIPTSLIALKSLSLASNKLTSINIPEELVALETLHLASNKLTSINIPEALVALETLLLYNNQLTLINNIPTTLVALKKLDLSINQLTSINIPEELVALRELYLHKNKLTSINIPEALVALETLLLYNNQLNLINIPTTLMALQKLDLSINQLTSINIPKGLVALRELYLHKNKLTSINTPVALTALQWLRLDHNQLTSINIPATLAALEVNLERNPLTIATKVALEALRRTLANHNFQIYYDNKTPAAQITNDILDMHFKPMLRSHPERIIAHLKKTGAAWLLSYLPYELAGKIGEYVEPTLGISRALASMTNFQGIFSNLSILHGDSNEQLNTLNLYNERFFKRFVKKTKNYYANAFRSKTIEELGLVNKFLRKNGFDSADLNKKNSQGFTPLALAKANITSHHNQNAEAIIPLIQSRTSYKGVMYAHLTTASKAVYNHKELIATSAAMAAAAALLCPD